MNDDNMRVPHKIMHFFFFTGSGGSKAARIASSKTFFKPFCVSAEHSTYFTALSSRANFSAASTVIGFCFTLESFSIVPASSRKSICVPTSRNGVFGQWCVISGTHWKKMKIETKLMLNSRFLACGKKVATTYNFFVVFWALASFSGYSHHPVCGVRKAKKVRGLAGLVHFIMWVTSVSAYQT